MKNKAMTALALFALLAASLLFLFSCLAPERQEVSFFGAFDTYTTVYDYSGDDPELFGERAEKVKALLEDYHRLFDIYNEYEGVVNLKSINDKAGEGPVEVDERIMELLLYSKEMYELTDGRVNVAMGAVLKIWHEFRESGRKNPESSALPSRATLELAAEHTNIDDLLLDPENMTVELRDPYMSLDVGAIAKGYAVERAAELLSSLGADGYVLDVGSNLRIVGSIPPRGEIEVYIRDPENPSGTVGYIEAEDTSVVTSGVYERYYTVQGKRYHHIIDPETLMPSERYLSVSVITEDSALADSLSTALFCLSPDEAQATVLRARELYDSDLCAVFILPDGSIIGEIKE